VLQIFCSIYIPDSLLFIVFFFFFSEWSFCSGFFFLQVFPFSYSVFFFFEDVFRRNVLHVLFMVVLSYGGCTLIVNLVVDVVFFYFFIMRLVFRFSYAIYIRGSLFSLGDTIPGLTFNC
jgi:hypothetical protein